jgi:hypothetical protein
LNPISDSPAMIRFTSSPFLKGTFEDKSVGTNKIVNISNLALGGDDVNNYNLL